MTEPTQALFDFRAVPSEETDVEFTSFDDGSLIATPQTSKGMEVTRLYGRHFRSYEEAFRRAQMMHQIWGCRVKLEPPATPVRRINTFRAQIEDRLGNPRLVIANHSTYWIEEEPADVRAAQEWAQRGGPLLGHSGRGFHIRFNDGREVLTHNLWAGAQVPHELYDEFPDNAQIKECH